MSRRSGTIRREQRTASEKGAAMAYVAAVERLHRLDTEPQLDLFVSRPDLRREWLGILGAAVAALA